MRGVFELPLSLRTALGIHRKTGPITTLHVFDFDGTLVRTPGPEEGKPAYRLATGKSWRGGWWGRPESLSPPVVLSPFPQNRVIDLVFSELEEVVTRSQTAVAVVVTGRIKPLRPAVLRILDEVCIARQNDTVPQGHSFLHHDAVITHPGGGINTLDFKQQLFKQLLTSDPLLQCSIKELHIWEDRLEHAQVFTTTFTNEVRTLANIETTVHFVPSTLP